MKKPSLVRTIYLYLFATVGLAVLIIGTIRFVDMGLKAFVFTKADQQERDLFKQPSMPYQLERVEGLENNEELSEQDRADISQWLADYKLWQQSQSEADYLTIQRHRDGSINLSMILVGLPLYLYHWGVIKKETREREKEREEEREKQV